MKARLYLDVDDTLIAEHFNNSGFDLRPGVITQLKVLSKLFDCYWLTHWPKDKLSMLWRSLYAGKLMNSISYMDWKRVNPDVKAEAVLKGPKDFWWLEDTLSTGHMDLLRDAGLLHRYIPVSAKGPWGFTEAVRVLFTVANIGKNELSRVSAKIGWFSKGLPDVDKFNQLDQGTFATGFVTDGKQHCGDCIHRPGEKPFCTHPLVLKDPELKSRLTLVGGISLISIDGDRDCCEFSNKNRD